MLAVALAGRPDLLIADEPTTALDVTIQAAILDLLLELRDQMGMSVILVTHDLGVVADLCDRVAVMYAGQIVEIAEVHELFANPRHPYTRALLDSVPSITRAGDRLQSLAGSVPPLDAMPPGCRFAARCAHVRTECLGETPPMLDLDGRLARCVRAHELDLRTVR
jgi:oligopeptide/dipeptide ABC transporter ATP-binding protein